HHPRPVGGERLAPPRALAFRDPRADRRVVADRVDALAEPVARGAAVAAARPHAVPVPAIRRADGAGVVPHLRRPAVVQVLRDRPAPVGPVGTRRHALRRPDHESPRGLQSVDHDHRRLLPLVQRGGDATPRAACVARPRPRADGVAAVMTNTPTDEREVETGDGADALLPAPRGGDAETTGADPIPFWQRPLVERFLVPLVLPIAVVVGHVAYVLNISRLYLSGHGHMPIIVGSVITVMILLSASLLAAAPPRMRQSAI